MHIQQYVLFLMLPFQQGLSDVAVEIEPSASDHVVCREMAQSRTRTLSQQPQLCSGSMAKSSKVTGQATTACRHALCMSLSHQHALFPISSILGKPSMGPAVLQDYKGVLRMSRNVCENL